MQEGALGMTLPEQAAALREDIRSALSITWADADTDRQLTGIIARGMAYLNDIAGSEQDYAAEGKAKELLIHYCLYARSGALDQFAVNYLGDLAYFQQCEEVRRFAQEAGHTGLP